MLTEKDKQGNWRLKGVDWQQLTATGKEIREKLYGALAKLKDYEETGLQPDEVEELKEKNRWIPIEERFPEPGKYVLLHFENFDIPSVGTYENDEEGGREFYMADDASCSTFGLCVDAWLSLPEPYGEEK